MDVIGTPTWTEKVENVGNTFSRGESGTETESNVGNSCRDAFMARMYDCKDAGGRTTQETKSRTHKTHIRKYAVDYVWNK